MSERGIFVKKLKAVQLSVVGGLLRNPIINRLVNYFGTGEEDMMVVSLMSHTLQFFYKRKPSTSSQVPLSLTSALRHYSPIHITFVSLLLPRYIFLISHWGLRRYITLFVADLRSLHNVKDWLSGSRLQPWWKHR